MVICLRGNHEAEQGALRIKDKETVDCCFTQSDETGPHQVLPGPVLEEGEEVNHMEESSRQKKQEQQRGAVTGICLACARNKKTASGKETEVAVQSDVGDEGREVTQGGHAMETLQLVAGWRH